MAPHSSPRPRVGHGLLSVLLGLCVSAAVLASPSRASAAIITAVPEFGAVLVDDVFDVDFRIDDFDDLIAFQFGVNYDFTRLSVEGVTEGDFLSSAGGTSFFAGDSSVDGLITFVANALSGSGPGATGGGSLFRVRFRATATGVASVAPFVDDTVGDGLMQSDFAVVAPDVDGAGITIDERSSSVPEPATVSLLAIGAAFSAAARRRKRRSAAATR